MSKLSKFKAWTLIALSYVFSYGATLVSAYHYLAKDQISGKGGGFFYTVVGITLILAIVSINRLLNKMDANTFKSIFKGLMKIGIVFVLMFVATFISVNFDELSKVLMFTMFGLALGTLVEVLAVHKYGDYIREVGVL